MECFLKKFLVSEYRQQPTDSIEANMWLIKYVEELPHRGSKRAEPKPAMCTVYQAGLSASRFNADKYKWSPQMSSCIAGTCRLYTHVKACPLLLAQTPGSLVLWHESSNESFHSVPGLQSMYTT